MKRPRKRNPEDARKQVKVKVPGVGLMQSKGTPYVQAHSHDMSKAHENRENASVFEEYGFQSAQQRSPR